MTKREFQEQIANKLRDADHDRKLARCGSYAALAAAAVGNGWFTEADLTLAPEDIRARVVYELRRIAAGGEWKQTTITPN